MLGSVLKNSIKFKKIIVCIYCAAKIYVRIKGSQCTYIDWLILIVLNIIIYISTLHPYHVYFAFLVLLFITNVFYNEQCSRHPW